MGLGLQPAIGRATFRLNSVVARLLPQRRHLITLTYHRVGTAEQLFPDPKSLAECDLAQFETEMAWLGRHCTVLDMAQALSVVGGERPCPSRAVLVTFDDGYRDDLLRVRPCLERAGIRPTVFLPTDYVGSARRFWWDRVGACVQLSRRRSATVRLGNEEVPLELERPADQARAIERLMGHAKNLGSSAERERFVGGLEQALEVADTSLAERPQIVGWDEVRQLRAVFDFGAHTESHAVLSQLGAEEARRELVRSREIIEQQLGQPCRTVAIPYGGASDYTPETVRIAAEAGYSALFSLEETLRGPLRHGELYLIDRVALNARAGPPGMALKLTWPRIFVPHWSGQARRLLGRLGAGST